MIANRAKPRRTGGGEEPWYEATWSWEGSGFGPHKKGAGEPEAPQIDLAMGLNVNQTLYDFIRERM